MEIDRWIDTSSVDLQPQLSFYLIKRKTKLLPCHKCSSVNPIFTLSLQLSLPKNFNTELDLVSFFALFPSFGRKDAVGNFVWKKVLLVFTPYVVLFPPPPKTLNLPLIWRVGLSMIVLNRRELRWRYNVEEHQEKGRVGFS
uniref:Uncharacterized protein LOC107419752 n=1 Tax=Rhizophora mucronata TaxID=61149 RepID=A0A2P2KSN6_RHIMU